MYKTLKILLFGIFLSQSSMAKSFPTIDSVIHASFPKSTKMDKHSLILTKKQFSQIQQTAKAKVTTKVYRYYTLSNNGKTIGYAVLVFRKVRTKKATVIYGFDMKGTLKFTEIMAFSEPPEFIPSSIWMGQLQNKSASTKLTVGKDIPTISGATLSARSVTDAARIARAIYEIVLK
ncbi:MAG: FMN-binding protein [Sulfurovum sp.]|nr:FMN-binding protein [Sulfurovum sp.]